MKHTLTIVCVILALSAMAKDVYVDDDNYNDEYVDDSAAYIAAGYDGTTPEKAFGTIQAAIDASTTKADDTILVCPGTYDKGGRMFNYSSSDAGYTRVIATKKLTIKSTEGAAKTHIVGKMADTDNGRGVGAYRCFGQYWTKTTLQGFTLRDGSTEDGGLNDSGAQSNDRPKDRGGAVFTAVANNSAPTYVVDCVISNCTARQGVIRNGAAIRCLICDNESPSGAAGMQVTFYSCIITRNRGSAGLVSSANTCIVNCTVVGNNTYTAVSSANVGRNNIVAQSHSSGSDITGTSLANNVCGATDGIFQTIAPAVGDFRVIAGSVAATAGSSEGVDGSDCNVVIPEEYRNLDFHTNRISGTGICAGALQETAVPAGGGLMFNGISSTSQVKVNGWRSIKAGSYLFPTSYPCQYRVEPVLESGKIYAWDTYDAHGDFHLPDAKTDVTYLMPPPQTDVVMTNSMILAKKEIWLDPEDGNDTTGTGEYDTPYRTLQKGVESSVDYTFIYCKAGTYAEGGGTNYWGVANRVYFGWRAARFIGVEGAENTFIRGEADTTSPVESQPGCGPAAMRAICVAGSGITGFEGFTFTNCHTLARADEVTEANGHQGGICRTTSSTVTFKDCVIDSSCTVASSCFSGARLVRCTAKGLSHGIGGSTQVACYWEDCYANEYWPSSHGFHCTFRNMGTLAWNYACVGSGGARVRTDSAAKFAGSVMHNYTTYEAGTTGYVTDDPLFASSTGPSVRRCSPAFTCGEVPTAENYGAEYYKHVSTDFYGRPLTFVNGKPVAGADQLGVFEIFAKKRFTATAATADVTESANGVISVPQGGSMTVVAPAGALNRRGGLVLMMSVPADGSLSVAVNGVTYDFGAGTHSLKLPSGASATELRFTGIAETSTLLALNSGAGFALSFR